MIVLKWTHQGLYRDPVSDNDTLASDTTNMGNLPWEQVFTDPQLQALIRLGLKQNTDLQSAIQNVKAAEAGLMSARAGLCSFSCNCTTRRSQPFRRI